MYLVSLKICLLLFSLFCVSGNQIKPVQQKIFDTHLHFKKDFSSHFQELKVNNVTRAALSGSWEMAEQYRAESKGNLLIGIMLPCPNGIVPYHGPKCFRNGKDYPDSSWVREQILNHKIDFFGELLNEYYGISLSDSSMFPYYALALEFKLPVGIHTGLAGPDHGCPNYKPEMGDPKLMKLFLDKYPGLKVWIMHAGAPYLESTLKILSAYPNVFADISVISNPEIVASNDFHTYMKSLIDAGFEDRLMFGSDNGDLDKIIIAVNGLDFLSGKQKEKIFYDNAQKFFSRK